MAASTEVQDVHQLRRTFRPLSSVWPRKTEGGVIGGFREHYRISVTSSLVPPLRTFLNAMASSRYQSEAVKRLGRSFSTRHWDQIVATDFFTMEVWTYSGLTRSI